MSGFQNVTGFAAPTSAAGFMALLQSASFRGVPFHVVASQIKKGRKVAVHDYPPCYRISLFDLQETPDMVAMIPDVGEYNIAGTSHHVWVCDI